MTANTRKLNTLKNWDKNPRAIKTEDFARLKNQIQTLGLYKPFLITSDGTVLGGNMRLRACKELGIDEVPVSVVQADTDALKLQYALSDNDRAGYYDEQALAELVLSMPDIDLQDYKIDLGNLISIDELLAKFGPEPVEDEVPEVTEEAVSQLGEVYQLGRHRVMCGDSTKIEDVEKLMDGKKADMVFTSPPYAAQRQYSIGEFDWDSLMNGVFGILPTHESSQVFVNLGLVHNDGEYVEYWHEWLNDYMPKLGWRRFGWYVWDQGSGLPGDWNGRLAPSHEFIFHLNKQSVKPNKTIEKKAESIEINDYGTGMRGKNGKTPGRMSSPEASLATHKIPDSVIRVTRHMARGMEMEHPAVFPVSLPTELIKAFPSKTIYDPFLGSGSTLIACEQTNRICYGMELDPKYCDVIRKRYAKLIKPDTWEDEWEQLTPVTMK